MRWRIPALLLSPCFVLASVAPALGDEVLFLNGDRLTGTILKATGGKLTIKTEGAGEVTVDLSKVKTFSTDEPVQLVVGEQPPVCRRLRPPARPRSPCPSPTSR